MTPSYAAQIRNNLQHLGRQIFPGLSINEKRFPFMRIAVEGVPEFAPSALHRWRTKQIDRGTICFLKARGHLCDRAHLHSIEDILRSSPERDGHARSLSSGAWLGDANSLQTNDHSTVNGHTEPWGVTQSRQQHRAGAFMNAVSAALDEWFLGAVANANATWALSGSVDVRPPCRRLLANYTQRYSCICKLMQSAHA
jgi:hypothetical protein